jgi:uncharacterized LabA/DUF88 family protein
MATRVGVFIDWQNCYRSAQDAFGPGTNGNVNPLALARHLVQAGADRELVHLHIHSGVHSNQHNPRAFGARLRQHEAWRRLDPCVKVFPRTLAYRKRQGVVVPQEKGIDVAVAVDLTRRCLVERSCEIGVLVSADTDLLPALELIVEVNGGRAVEVATWSGAFFAPQSLSLQGHRIWQHLLDDRLYRAIEDQTDYTSHQLPTGPTG